MSGNPTAAEQAGILTEGCIDVVRRVDLEARLDRAVSAGKPLTIKAGFDPSSPDIHLGHVVLLRKMKQFQDLGHHVVFVVGDFTAMIGDPTGRSKTRPQLSRMQIVENAETYRRQAAKILDDSKAEFRYNSEWLDALGSTGLIKLAAKYNVARMLERRDFRQRFDSGQSIAVHEFLYPLAQAYDSVVLEADVELGGTDQLFNLNVGRDIMPEYDLAPQIVMTTPLLEGLDGVEKMSKSLGNYVGIEDPPREMFGKLMSISDALMWKYWALLGGVPAILVELAKAAAAASLAPGDGPASDRWPAFVEALGKGEADAAAALAKTGGTPGQAAFAGVAAALGISSFHPREIKAGFARRTIATFHGAVAARDAEREFEQIFAQKENPSEIEEIVRPVSPDLIWLPKLLAEIGLAKSNGEAIRLIQQGGVAVDGVRIDSKDHHMAASGKAAYLIKVGKRRFVRLRFE